MANLRTSRILTFIIIIYAAYVIWDLTANVNDYMWDYKCYHYSVNCLDQNLNPYHTEDLSIFAKRDWLTPYVYPPLTLNFFRILIF